MGMTNHKDILTQAIHTLRERGLQYGSVEETFDRTAKLASTLLNTEISAYEVVMIHVATKLARLQEARTLDDNYIDAMNYMAMAAQFAPVHSRPKFTLSQEQEPIGILEDDIAEIAKRFAPARPPQSAPVEEPKQD
jgi:hypothetical protein